MLASIDDGLSYAPVGATALPATMGGRWDQARLVLSAATATRLPAGATALIDAANVVDVVLLNAGMTLSDADTPALLGGANHAIAISATSFCSSAGRSALVPTAGGCRSCGADGGARKMPSPPSRREAALSSSTRRPRRGERARGPGGRGDRRDRRAGDRPGGVAAQALAGVRVMASGPGDRQPWPEAQCATAGRAALPLSPVHPVVQGLAPGDAQIGWTRRSRADDAPVAVGGWTWRDGTDAPLGEEREAYRIRWFDGSAETAEPSFTYGAALRARHRAARIATMAFEIRQAGDLGLSPPLFVNIDLN